MRVEASCHDSGEQSHVSGLFRSQECFAEASHPRAGLDGCAIYLEKLYTCGRLELISEISVSPRNKHFLRGGPCTVKVDMFSSVLCQVADEPHEFVC